MADLLGIGTSGLLSFQRALTTTSHNISNVNTDGYSRQRVELATRLPQRTGAGFFGQGVGVVNVTRNFDQFKIDQVRNYTATNSRHEIFHDLSSQIDNLLADPDAGLAPAMEEFFNAVQGVADNPSSQAARQVMMSDAESLVERFHYLDQRLTDLNEQANQRLTSVVDEINAMAKAIAELNVSIARETGAANGKPPNDLLDQRDLIINQLSEKVKVTTLPQDDGQLNVFIGTGQSLVLGGTSTELALRPSEFVPTRLEIVIDDGRQGVNVTNLLTGGELSGVVDFVQNILEPSRKDLGRVAMSVAESFNAQHRLGLDLEGLPGADFFAVPGAQVLSPGGNIASGQPTVTISDINQLTTDDYMVEQENGNWTITNLTSNRTTLLGAGPGPYTIDGIDIDLSSVSGAANGDAFMIRPTFMAANDIAMKLNDPTRIAAAGPLIGGERTTAPLNSGTASIENVYITDPSVYPLGGDITFTYDEVAREFTLSGAVTGTIPYDPAIHDGMEQSIAIGAGEIRFTIRGLPQSPPTAAVADQFTISNNTDATTDNRNALLLGGLQIDKTMLGGTATFQDVYGQMVADVGARTHQAEISLRASETLKEQAIAAHQSVSGVNLDEEAANLIRFQQAYQATAKIISTADTLFQTLLNAVGR